MDMNGEQVGDPVYYNKEYYHTRAELGHFDSKYRTFEGRYPVQYTDGENIQQGMINYSFVHVGN
jgi:hypothetical protein